MSTNPLGISTLKVRIPSPVLVQLHVHKVLTGESIASTVEAALVAYLASLDMRTTDEPTHLTAEAVKLRAA